MLIYCESHNLCKDLGPLVYQSDEQIWSIRLEVISPNWKKWFYYHFRYCYFNSVVIHAWKKKKKEKYVSCLLLYQINNDMMMFNWKYLCRVLLWHNNLNMNQAILNNDFSIYMVIVLVYGCYACFTPSSYIKAPPHSNTIVVFCLEN